MPQYKHKDPNYLRAKREGLVARSAYKIEELNKHYNIAKPGSKIVDLGCAPGGWLQILERKLQNKGEIVGVDLLPLKIAPGPKTTFIQGDFTDSDIQDQLQKALNGKASWIVSDLSPNISGIKFKDLDESLKLAEITRDFALKNLKIGGSLVLKIFPGSEFDDFRKKLKPHFKKSIPMTLETTRKTSNEIYLVALNFLSPN